MGGCREPHRIVENSVPCHTKTRKKGLGIASLIFEHTLVAESVDGDLGTRIHGDARGIRPARQSTPIDAVGVRRKVHRRADRASARLEDVARVHSDPLLV